MTEPRSSNLNVPNVLTVLRIIMVPLFVVVRSRAAAGGGGAAPPPPESSWPRC